MKELATGVLIWVAAVTSSFSREITVAYTGVSLNVLVACGIGTFCSFSWGEPVAPRSKLWRLAIACLFMGAAVTAITNAIIKHTTDLEMTDGLQAGVGAVVSCLTRFFFTWLVDALKDGRWLDYVPFLRKREP